MIDAKISHILQQSKNIFEIVWTFNSKANLLCDMISDDIKENEAYKH